jgi:hypothetical protein
MTQPGDESAPSAGSPTALSVQARLDGYREGLYDGRGPGISERERLRNTSLRAVIGGIPTATRREALHLRTMRARGRTADADAETAWAAAQFPLEPPPGRG